MGKLMRDTYDLTVKHTCPKCGQAVGRAFSQKSGKSYYARLVRREVTSFGAMPMTVRPDDDGKGTYLASKSHPHFLECTGTPAPGALAKGVQVRVISGRKVKVGTTGVITWIGVGQWGERVGLQLESGEVVYTALKNVAAVEQPGTSLMEEVPDSCLMDQDLERLG